MTNLRDVYQLTRLGFVPVGTEEIDMATKKAAAPKGKAAPKGAKSKATKTGARKASAKTSAKKAA